MGQQSMWENTKPTRGSQPGGQPPGFPRARLVLGVALLQLLTTATAATSGLARVELSSYYRPESAEVTPAEKPWTLPLTWPNVSNAARVCTTLNLGTNAHAALERNGMVVVPFGRATNVIEAYAFLREVGIPAFVTSDTLLHLYHVQFDDILKCVETNEFFAGLVTMSSALLDEALRQQTTFTGDLREAATRNAAFLAVALQLLGQSASVPAEAAALAQAESNLIETHSGFNASPIFIYEEDYSQYVPRGHYTRSETLKKYFKAMMWYGRLSFLLKGSDNFGPGGEALISEQDARTQTRQAALLALALDRLEAGGRPIADFWNRIYGVTAFFVGLADDLTPYEYREAMQRLFGASVNPELLTQPM